MAKLPPLRLQELPSVIVSLYSAEHFIRPALCRPEMESGLGKPLITAFVDVRCCGL